MRDFNELFSLARAANFFRLFFELAEHFDFLGFLGVLLRVVADIGVFEHVGQAHLLTFYDVKLGLSEFGQHETEQRWRLGAQIGQLSFFAMIAGHRRRRR